MGKLFQSVDKVFMEFIEEKAVRDEDLIEFTKFGLRVNISVPQKLASPDLAEEILVEFKVFI